MFLTTNEGFCVPYCFRMRPLLTASALVYEPCCMSFLKSIVAFTLRELPYLLAGLTRLNYSSTLTKSMAFEVDVIFDEFSSLTLSISAGIRSKSTDLYSLNATCLPISQRLSECGYGDTRSVGL